MSDLLTVQIDGKEHSYWTQATIARSIERGAHSFDLVLTDSFESNTSLSPRIVQPGMAVGVFINDEQIISGYVDDVSPSYDKQSHSLHVSGRSKLADLIDCSMVGKQFPIGQSLKDIASTLCQYFGIEVSVDSSASSVASESFKSIQMLDLGQSLWDFLEELARLKAVFLMSDKKGNLLITRSGSAQAEVSLELGKNILSASGNFSHRGVYSLYTVTGQQANDPQKNQDGKDNTQPIGRVSNTNIRFRPLTISSDNQADTDACKTRAKWQKNVNESRAKSITYTVPGWRQTPDGDLWAPNLLVAVKDDWMGWNESFLISETRFLLDENGSRTELYLKPKGAFDIQSRYEST